MWDVQKMMDMTVEWYRLFANNAKHNEYRECMINQIENYFNDWGRVNEMDK